MNRWMIWSYNLDNNRPNAVMANEVRAILRSRMLKRTQPKILGTCEALGYTMPNMTSYRLIRDQTRPARSNLAAYVHKDLTVTDIRWYDLKETWHRTQHPGIHWPRSILTFKADGVLVACVQQPPKYTDNVEESQAEGILTLLKISPDVVIGDMNRRRNESGPGPRRLARLLHGKVVGSRIDCAIVFSGKGKRPRYPTAVGWPPGRVQLRSDHGHAFRFLYIYRRNSK